MTTQVIRPAGAGHETLLIGLLCACILGLAGLFIAWRAAPEVASTLAAHQIDARRSLSPAEQGIFADLRVALSEILDAGGATLPTISQLQALYLPPFTQDASALRRGAHQWHRVHDGVNVAYVGLSTSLQEAGSMLLLVPEKGAQLPDAHHHAAGQGASDTGEPDIWLSRAEATLPASLEQPALIRAGWQQLVAQFDASVTREKRQP
ncbi:DUF6162 family protein [Allopusillimonas ginsengisoli]|uniref:DUF6162 family protein n=1 Tax=Allopusillimonas ginsengisoli TaxID=453575 RepID=UPI00101EBA22|nr:DUF6162 family protein [Allopusillimonas ginsengisoli]TEA79618.1 hypothetical protein ERE07_01320 [Allopusillimonas ginsengisoli]